MDDGVAVQPGPEAAAEADVFPIDEEVDVGPDPPLLVEHTVVDAGEAHPLWQKLEAELPRHRL